MPKRKTRETALKIIDILGEIPNLSIAELARILGYNRSWIWKNVKLLENEGIIELRKMGGIAMVSLTEKSFKGLLKIGILRAAEYPYIITFSKKLREIFFEIKIKVYDEAFKLSMDLATGKIHLGMAPVISLLVVHRLSGGRVIIIGGGSAGGCGLIYSKSKIESHATTMLSTMEFCAELKKLPGKRIYMKSGQELLQAASEGKVGISVAWEPYLEIARRKGLRVEMLEIPFCCTLGAFHGLKEYYDKIKHIFKSSLSSSEWDIEAYSSILNLPSDLITNSINSYNFFEDPPLEEIKKNIEIIKETILNEKALDEAIYK